MAICNVTPDSFYAGSRLLSPSSPEPEADAVLHWAERALSEGASILDIGGCSTRPGSVPADAETEWHRVAPALRALRKTFPGARLSLDTFRAEIARRALSEYGPLIINDVSGGDEAMYRLVRAEGVPYIWTLRGDLLLPSREPKEGIDLILDPGFGFTGGLECDYACLRNLDALRRYGKPVLAGISRKSMVYKPFGLSPSDCLTETEALQLYALEHGATILRTHDPAATARIVRLYEMIEGDINIQA